MELSFCGLKGGIWACPGKPMEGHGLKDITSKKIIGNLKLLFLVILFAITSYISNQENMHLKFTLPPVLQKKTHTLIHMLISFHPGLYSQAC